ncbi:hypothetical protein MMC11_007773 [Xylographa trunciseda]|nr:hypothetical protein [Xylographa trunciseda]
MNDSPTDLFSIPYDWVESDDESVFGRLTEYEGRQLTVDIVFGVLRDWTCIAAGLPGPWSESSDLSLKNVLNALDLFQSDPSTSVTPDWNPLRLLATTTREDLISIAGPSSAAKKAALSRSRGRLTRMWETSGHNTGFSVSTDLSEDVSSRKRRRIIPDRTAWPDRDVQDVHGNLRIHTNMPPSSSRNSGARASAARRVISEDQQARQKSQSTTTESLEGCKVPHQTAHPSRLPLTSKGGCVSAFFVSQLIPSTFTSLQRFQVLDVLHYEAPYIPTCIVGAIGRAPQLYYGSLHCNRHLLPEHVDDNTYDMSQALGPPTGTQPKATLPVEIFAQIARYLHRLDLQALLLTSKEFNAKVGPLYFQHVVLPFKSNIFSGLKNKCMIGDMYGKEKTENSAALPAVSTLLATTDESGEQPQKLPLELNMFNTWGTSITKFGFSLEAVQDELADAPGKQAETSYSTFYEEKVHWPAQEYLLNSTNRNLEMTADQKILMELAFSSLTNVNELALAVDSGLGYLESFDRSDRAKIVADKAKFFGRRYALSKEDEIRSWLEVGSSALARFSLHDRQIYDSYVKLLRSIPGLPDTLIDLVTYYINRNPRGTLSHLAFVDIFGHVKTIMLHEGVLYPHQQPREWSSIQNLLLANGAAEITGSLWNQRRSRPIPPHTLSSDVSDQISYQEYHTIAPSSMLFPESQRQNSSSSLPAWINSRMVSGSNHLHNLGIWDNFSMHAARHLNRDLLTRLFYRPADSPPPLIFDGLEVEDAFRTDPSVDPFVARSLKPRSLTLAQKQWLAETGWIQQAFMTSYITSIIKNKSNFATVRSFTLAKLSSCYLPRLHDREFWGALCSVENLTILVSPDWREINSGHKGEFSSGAIAPSRACSLLTKLLHEISSISTITSLKTGFVDGGEHAVGMFARNQHILPAPITNEERSKQYIVMPYIHNITFVNCWFAPSILKAFLGDMIRMRLRTIHFDSVSLIVAGGKTVTSLPLTWPANLPQELLADPSTGAKPPFYLGFGIRQPSIDAVVRQSQITPAYVHPNPPVQNGYVVPISWRAQQLHRDTWADIIDAYSPGQTLKEKRAALAGTPANQNATVKRKMLTILEFTSCGYAKLEHQGLGPVLDENQEPPAYTGLGLRKSAMRIYMMVSADPFLGQIVPKLVHPELAFLTGAFGMTVGPGNDPGRLDNQEDGQPDRGTGRFSGRMVGA